MNSNSAHFRVDTKLASILGESYKSTEAALKELVDNAWDADADNVWITLPNHLTNDPIIIKDDGSGMTEKEIREEYLNIASPRISRKGAKSIKYKRKVKGRKGIGKISGLSAASQMRLEACARGKKTILLIDKIKLLEVQADLEAIPLDIEVEEDKLNQSGTTIILSDLNQSLNFPQEDAFKAILMHEYGRSDDFKIFVNGAPLTVEDLLGKTEKLEKKFSNAGACSFNFTITEGAKTPKHPGIVLKVNGKVIGKPQLFGLEDDPEIPPKLLKRIYGEFNADDLNENEITADWGAVIENSKSFQEITEFIRSETKTSLSASYKKDINLQKARLQKDINLRLSKLPEHRRKYADTAINNILQKFYGEKDERISSVVNVVLDSMEQDQYWNVLKNIDEARHKDIYEFAEALEQFGLLEMTNLIQQCSHRLDFLDYLDGLISNTETLEKEVHLALEKSLWVLGNKYSLMSSNQTLKRVINEYTEKKYKGDNADKRPDLLLANDLGDKYLLIEFKRPSHALDRTDEAQVQKYRDELSNHLSEKEIEVIIIGGKINYTADSRYDNPSIKAHTYNDIISKARYDIDWLSKNFS